MSKFSETRVWLVTGSSQGLGRALVEAILNHGECVVATARNPNSLSDLRAKYPESQLLIQRLDVTLPEQVAETFEATKAHFNRLDVVINNAGYGLICELEDTPDVEARRIFETLFWGAVNVMKPSIKFMREVNPPGHGGRIFNISSAGGYQSNTCLAFYNGAKFALEGMTQSFIKEMPDSWNIKGCIIEPGGFRTEWNGSSMVSIPQSATYADPTFPSYQYRDMHDKIVFIGQPSRAAEAIFNLANEPELPLRLQLGSDSFLLVKGQAKKTLADQEKWEAVSHSTNADDHDKELMKKLVTMIH